MDLQGNLIAAFPTLLDADMFIKERVQQNKLKLGTFYLITHGT